MTVTVMVSVAETSGCARSVMVMVTSVVPALSGVTRPSLATVRIEGSATSQVVSTEIGPGRSDVASEEV